MSSAKRRLMICSSCELSMGFDGRVSVIFGILWTLHRLFDQIELASGQRFFSAAAAAIGLIGVCFGKARSICFGLCFKSRLSLSQEADAGVCHTVLSLVRTKKLSKEICYNIWCGLFTNVSVVISPILHWLVTTAPSVSSLETEMLNFGWEAFFTRLVFSGFSLSTYECFSLRSRHVKVQN